MAEKILIIGESGSGKSSSCRTLDSKTTAIINCIGKPLPFKGWKTNYQKFDPKTESGNLFETVNYEAVIKAMQYVALKKPEIKTLIIDDAQYIMTFEFMDRAMEKGYDKFSELAQHFFKVLKAADSLRQDLTVVFLAHSEEVSGNGYTKTKIKTIGKMLDEKLTIEGLFSCVLLATCYKDTDKEIKHIFVTKNNGTTTVKTPAGMFEDAIIPNDLQFVLNKIKEYEQ